MTALPAPDASWHGLVSFYSLIHVIDDADVRAALAEYRRVLAAASPTPAPKSPPSAPTS